MSEISEPNKAAQYCYVCAQVVKDLKAHKLKAHTPSKESERIGPIEAKNKLILEKARETYLRTQILCSGCKKHIALSDVLKHFKEQHAGIPSPDMQDIFNMADPMQHLKPAKAKVNTPKLPRQPRGDDVFDRNLVVSGGAYGLGKNRKH
ncbi:hypothetical protein HNP33_002528 [Comamonas odontotermitis]|uniref:C2H2-type domain-containing protein n=1 Tax=Comamonas odontotermitis TaxID=379895 RepID=A0ABR6RH04_9BURK|nr:hypothetical protein [Comamonas odontotermitis]MBB6578446.1 hypothetical protein [Comamonas odontotermitis]